MAFKGLSSVRPPSPATQALDLAAEVDDEPLDSTPPPRPYSADPSPCPAPHRPRAEPKPIPPEFEFSEVYEHPKLNPAPSGDLVESKAAPAVSALVDILANHFGLPAEAVEKVKRAASVNAAKHAALQELYNEHVRPLRDPPPPPLAEAMASRPDAWAVQFQFHDCECVFLFDKAKHPHMEAHHGKTLEIVSQSDSPF